MKNSTPPHKSSLKNTLLERIEQENYQPRSRWFFRSRECVIWFLWLITVIVGAAAFAVSFFVMTHYQYALYEATHANFLTFIISALPYIWLIVFAIMTFLAVYNLRHTKRGYRYSVPTVLMSSILVSFAAGSTLHFFGLSYAIDSYLGEQTRMYQSQDEIDVALWQRPAEGRLLGREVYSTAEPTRLIIFADEANTRWQMDVSELMPEDIELLQKNKPVRVLGMVTKADYNQFHACGVFPWTHQKDMTRQDLSKNRQEFLQKMSAQHEYAREQLEAIEEEVFGEGSSTSPLTTKVCAEIAMMKRISRSME